MAGRPAQAVVRRLLLPHADPQQPLPPIFTSEGAPHDLDDEIYLFLAYTLRTYVVRLLVFHDNLNAWYHPLTPRSSDLIPTLAQLLISILQALSTRLHTGDLVDWVLEDVPVILENHVRCFREAGRTREGKGRRKEVYAVLNPHKGVLKGWSVKTTASKDSQPPSATTDVRAPPTPYEGPLDPLYFTQLATYLLPLLLPAPSPTVPAQGEDKVGAPSASLTPIERSFAVELVGRTILLSILTKVSRPVFWWSLLLSLFARSSPSTAADEVDEAGREGDRDGLGFLGGLAWVLLMGLNILQGLLRAVEKAWMFSLWVWRVRKDAQLSTPASGEGRADVLDRWVSCVREVCSPVGGVGTTDRLVWAVLGGLVRVLGRLGLDEIVPHLLSTALSPSLALTLVKKLREIMFPLPGGFPAPPLPMAESMEAWETSERRLEERLRGEVGRSLEGRIPPLAEMLLFPPRSPSPSTDRHSTSNLLLDPLSSERATATLLVQLVDSLVLRVFSELGLEKGG